MAGFAETVATFAADLTLDDVPDDVVDRARETLVDTIGVTLAGMSDPTVRDLAERLAEDSAAPTTPLLGTDLAADPLLAALVHGTAGVWHDFDAGNRFAGGHPAVHAVPAAISTSAGRAVSGARFLEAILAGYEVAARIGRGTTLRQGMHPHGTWATVGAAVTSALLRGLDTDGVREALNASTSLTIATSWTAAFEGATIRNVFAGAGAASGVLAAELASVGFTGERDGVATVFGGLSGVSWDEETALEGLGDRWEIGFGYTKLLASARYLHPAVDAVVDALDGRSLEPDEIEAIEVHTFDFAASMTEVDPPNPLAAKFSLPHSVAAQIVLGDGGIPAFEDDALGNPRIRDLARRVEVAEDPAMTDRTPTERPASVRIRLRDGTVLSAERSLPHGDADPVSDEALRSKFVACATRAIPEDRAHALLDALWDVTGVDDVADLW
ncbi:MAG: MmgE/PrpD family protein [Acidimicrobiia bacterium]|nr:MmgE/PrpD family protein [Acidimicrobiia bacterium]